MILPVKGALQFVGTNLNGFLTDHSRSPLQWDFQQIGYSNRTVAGTLRSYNVAKKRTLTVDWTKVPSEAALTVDTYWGGSEIQTFYLTETAPFTVRVFNRDKGRKYYADTNPEVSLLMQFESFNTSIVYRNVALSANTIADLWDVSFTLVEI
jgi:hypothetical protein